MQQEVEQSGFITDDTRDACLLKMDSFFPASFSVSNVGCP